MGLYERDYYHESDLQPIQPWNSRSMVSILIVVNVVLFVANFLMGSSAPNKLTAFLWLESENIKQPTQLYRLLTNGFAHANIAHIFFNMLSLFFLGQSVESKYGRNEFLRYFLIAILFGSLIWSIRHLVTGSPAIVLGASGGVTAVTMLFVFNFPQAILHIWGVLPVKAWMIGVLVVVVNLLGNSSLSINGKSHVAYDVHLAGAAFAALYFYGKLDFGALGSLGTAFSNLFKRRPNLKIHAPEDEPVASAMQIEADRILEKIHRDGQESLTAKERKLLEEYSRAVRKQRQQ